MKKIFLSIVAVAAIAACTKSEVVYDTPEEIGFVPVAKLNTKAAVAGTDYPDALNMYVFANAGLDTDKDNTVEASECTEAYFLNAEFEDKTPSDDTHVFSGKTPYYWPNVKKLIFSGYSNSGNVESLTQTPTYDGSKITIKGYTPGAGTSYAGSNDLMWFPTTAPVGRGDKATGQELVDGNVDVTMKHACAWVTIILMGDAVTANATTPWKVEGLKVLNLSQTADVALGTAADWSNPSTGAELVLLNLNNEGDKKYEGKALTTTGEDYTNNDWGALVNNLVVIPQSVKGLEVSYNFVSQKTSDTEIVIDETLPISLTPTGAPTNWDAGKHYTYTITITAQQILVEPTVDNWDTKTQAVDHN